jgi:hypothetical protein
MIIYQLQISLALNGMARRPKGFGRRQFWAIYKRHFEFTKTDIRNLNKPRL